MNKLEVVKMISDSANLPKTTVATVVNGLHEAIGEILKKGDTVRIPGFGIFYTSKREARKGRNPKTGEVLEISARIVPKFRAGKRLKNAVVSDVV